MLHDRLKDKKIALLIWNTDKEDDAHVFLGHLEQQADDIYFINNEKGWRMRLDPDKLEQIREVPADLKEIFLNADLSVTLYMAALPGDQKEGFEPTGLNWFGE